MPVLVTLATHPVTIKVAKVAILALCGKMAGKHTVGSETMGLVGAFGLAVQVLAA